MVTIQSGFCLEISVVFLRWPGMVVDHLPTPLQLSPERVERLMCGSAKTFDSFPTPTQLLEDGRQN